LPIGNFYAIIVPMANKFYSAPGTEEETRRFTESLQYYNKLLFEANEELKQATRARSEFTAKISHEFRAPLNIVIGFTELMLDEVPGKINEEQRQSLEDILASSKQLLSLVISYFDQPEKRSDRANYTEKH
jgi:signal transduction histidine kinase